MRPEDAREHVTHDDAVPIDLSAQVAGIRELAWHLDTILERLEGRFAKLAAQPEALRHDQDGDPAATLAMIELRVGDVRRHLAGIDDALGDAHNLAARLAET